MKTGVFNIKGNKIGIINGAKDIGNQQFGPQKSNNLLAIDYNQTIENLKTTNHDDIQYASDVIEVADAVKRPEIITENKMRLYSQIAPKSLVKGAFIDTLISHAKVQVKENDEIKSYLVFFSHEINRNGAVEVFKIVEEANEKIPVAIEINPYALAPRFPIMVDTLKQIIEGIKDEREPWEFLMNKLTNAEQDTGTPYLYSPNNTVENQTADNIEGLYFSNNRNNFFTILKVIDVACRWEKDKVNSTIDPKLLQKCIDGVDRYVQLDVSKQAEHRKFMEELMNNLFAQFRADYEANPSNNSAYTSIVASLLQEETNQRQKLKEMGRQFDESSVKLLATKQDILYNPDNISALVDLVSYIINKPEWGEIFSAESVKQYNTILDAYMQQKNLLNIVYCANEIANNITLKTSKLGMRYETFAGIYTISAADPNSNKSGLVIEVNGYGKPNVDFDSFSRDYIENNVGHNPTIEQLIEGSKTNPYIAYALATRLQKNDITGDVIALRTLNKKERESSLGGEEMKQKAALSNKLRNLSNLLAVKIDSIGYDGQELQQYTTEQPEMLIDAFVTKALTKANFLINTTTIKLTQDKKRVLFNNSKDTLLAYAGTILRGSCVVELKKMCAFKGANNGSDVDASIHLIPTLVVIPSKYRDIGNGMEEKKNATIAVGRFANVDRQLINLLKLIETVSNDGSMLYKNSKKVYKVNIATQCQNLISRIHEKQNNASMTKTWPLFKAVSNVISKYQNDLMALKEFVNAIKNGNVAAFDGKRFPTEFKKNNILPALQAAFVNSEFVSTIDNTSDWVSYCCVKIYQDAINNNNITLFVGKVKDKMRSLSAQNASDKDLENFERTANAAYKRIRAIDEIFNSKNVEQTGQETNTDLANYYSYSRAPKPYSTTALTRRNSEGKTVIISYSNAIVDYKFPEEISATIAKSFTNQYGQEINYNLKVPTRIDQAGIELNILLQNQAVNPLIAALNKQLDVKFSEVANSSNRSNGDFQEVDRKFAQMMNEYNSIMNTQTSVPQEQLDNIESEVAGGKGELGYNSVSNPDELAAQFLASRNDDNGDYGNYYNGFEN